MAAYRPLAVRAEGTHLSGWPCRRAAGPAAADVRTVRTVTGTYVEAQAGTGAGAPAAPLDPQLREELLRVLHAAGGVFADVVEAYRAGKRTPSEIAATGADASGAWLGGVLLRVRVVLGEAWPNTPNRAQRCARTVRQLLKQTPMSPAARDHLVGLIGRLTAAAEDPGAQAVELAQLETESAQLESTLHRASGVYVYTYPQYWRHPVAGDSGRHLLKVGKTTQGAWKRVLDQARATAAPEDPVLLRVYEAADPDAAERAFHRLLDAAEHTRQETRSGGREWFATTLLFLDEIARTLGLPVHAGQLPD